MAKFTNSETGRKLTVNVECNNEETTNYTTSMSLDNQYYDQDGNVPVGADRVVHTFEYHEYYE